LSFAANAGANDSHGIASGAVESSLGAGRVHMCLRGDEYPRNAVPIRVLKNAGMESDRRMAGVFADLLNP
jgi:hypothetical protein